MLALSNGHLGVVQLLSDFQKIQIREGFELSGSLYFHVDLIELVIEFAVFD